MHLSRAIVDPDGVRWLVYEIAPVAPTPTLEPLRARHERRRSWLAFESEHGAVRELVPVPEGWPRCGDALLGEWLERAAPLDPGHARRRSDPRVEPPAGTDADHNA